MTSSSRGTVRPVSVEPPASTMPAWLLSSLIHLAAVLVLVLLVRPARPPAGVESDRSGGITLARITEADRVVFRQAAPAAASDSPQASTREAVMRALPASRPQSEISLPAIDLPGATPATSTLPQLPDLSAAAAARRPVLPSHADHSDLLQAEADRRRRQAALGPTTELTVFGSPAATGRSFVFAIDRSNSMGSDGLGVLRLARQELQRAVAALEPIHKFQIVAYHHQTVRLSGGRLLPALPDNQRRIAPFMDGLAAFGGTNHMIGLQSALALHPDVIFLLTDGGDPPLTAGQLTMIRRQAAGRTAICCLQFGREPAPGESNFLQRLAAQNGGSYRYVRLGR